MTSVLIASTIGLGMGIIVTFLMDPYKPKHGAFITVGIVLFFAGIGWWVSHGAAPNRPECDQTQVEVITPNVKGCMTPDEVAKLDPEVLGQ